MFSLIHHSDPDKRKAFLSGYEAAPSPRLNSKKEHLTYQDTLIAWESAPHIPVHTHQEANGVQVWVLGHIEDLDAEANPAEFLFKHYTESGHEGCAGYSGFFVFILLDGDNLIAGTDQLGLFPAYYYQSGDCFVLGSSPATPHMLPGISMEPDIHGIIGILLAMHELDNRSVWSGVRRIPADKILHINRHRLELLSGASLPVSDEHFSLPFESHVDIADEAMTAAMQKHREIDLLLSGGLDSRLVSAYLNRSSITPRKCYTMGKTTDIEWKCAHPVVRYLGSVHEQVPVNFDNYERYIRMQVSQEQLSNGLADVNWWSLADLPRNKPMLPLMNGFFGDAILGGSHMPWALNLKERNWSANNLFDSVNEWGVDIETIKGIHNKDVTDTIDEMVNIVKNTYNGFPGYPYQKSWQYDLRNRQRYHIGGFLCRAAYNFWPAVPYTSNVILKCAGGMPAASIMQRRIQKELLRREFPKLAALPLDNNSLSPQALSPSVPRRIISKLKNYIPRKQRNIRSFCYYHRVFNIENPGWRPLFEQRINIDKDKTNSDIVDRQKIGRIFSRIFDKDRDYDMIGDVSYKNLLGLYLWLEENF